VPLDPDLVQKAKAAGKVSINILEPGKKLRLEIRDYLQPGDLVGVNVNPSTNSLLALNVSSYVESPKDDSVELVVKMGNLADGTAYSERMTLDAPSESLKVVVENSGYRKSSP